MKMLFLVLLLFPGSPWAPPMDLEVVQAKADLGFATDLKEAQEGELWGYHSGAIGQADATSTLAAQGANAYEVQNLADLDLTTAWVEGAPGWGIGTQFSFTLDYAGPYSGYAQVYNFAGVIEVFNGYCKSEKVWRENGRVKRLKLLLNGDPICLIDLVDTWQYQTVDLRKFFREPRAYPNAPFVLADQDVLTFEILEVYEGTAYEDTALSEFVFSNVVSN